MRRQLFSLRHAFMSFAEPAIPTATPPASGTLAGSSWRSLLETNKATSRVASFATTSAVPKDAAKTTRKNTFSACLRSLLRDYKQLSKARLSALVVATAAAGYAAGSEERIDWKGMGWTSLGTMLTASSANALNQAYEIANDARMRRTATRPLPAGRMTRSHALVFALLTGGTGLWVLAKHANGTTAALGAANLALYAGVYTPLKQLSVVNTWVGAVVGAVPPLMGWAAAAGGLDIGAFLLAAGLYFWQMPHFMALAWLCREDYAAGGYRMLSAIDPTGRRTAACALRNCAYLLPLGMAAAWLGVTTPYFAYESSFITAGMLLTAARFYSKPSNPNARLLFRASLLHLPIFMIAFLLHRRPNTGEDRAMLARKQASLLGLVSRDFDDDEYYGRGEEQEQHDGEPAAAETLSNAYEQDRGDASQAVWRLHGSLKDATLEKSGGFAHVMSAVSLPPLPFLPVPHLDLGCPAKVHCADSEKEAAAERIHSTKSQ